MTSHKLQFDPLVDGGAASVAVELDMTDDFVIVADLSVLMIDKVFQYGRE